MPTAEVNSYPIYATIAAAYFDPITALRLLQKGIPVKGLRRANKKRVVRNLNTLNAYRDAQRKGQLAG